MTTNAEGKTPILQIRHVSKRFDTTQALDDVSLDLFPGEIHALMGENGAGKSTLIKIMTGVYHADEGEMLLDGEPIQVANNVPTNTGAVNLRPATIKSSWVLAFFARRTPSEKSKIK